MERKQIRYSEAFKLHVVREMETGDLRSVQEARLRYGIPGSDTVQSWLRRYGKNELINKVVRVEMPNEIDQLKALKAEVNKLKAALADAYMSNMLDGKLLEIACERLGMSPEEFKKKHGAKP